MTKDRLVQLVASMTAAVLLLGAAVLIPAINTQRRDLQLSADPVVGDNIPPHIAIATTAAGAFRGLLVDALWYRVEMQKRDGQYREANSLSEAIVSLQPRFPQVWSFIAWNQAYNISVGTYTAEERWDWVSKGERMLRTRGIPYNPNAVILYKELAWIWFHKIGGNTDDFHHYYKYQVARQWEHILGPPPPGADPQIVRLWFEPIRDAADRYFVFARPSHQMTAVLDQLEARAVAAQQTEAVAKLREMDVIRLRDTLASAERVARLLDGGRGADEEAQALLKELRALADDAARRSVQDPLTALFAEKPDAKPLINAMRELGIGFDDGSVLQTVERIGRLASWVRVIRPDEVDAWAGANLSPEDQTLLRLMLDPGRDQQWRAVLPFLRARAIVRGMHMDPGKMYDMMAMYGPLDWRHPTSHSLYWSRLGVERSGILNDNTKVDILNTYRGVVHALQTLTDTGRVNYDPLSGRPPTYQPDPRFIDAYDRTVVEGKQWVTNPDGSVEFGSGVIRSFKAGHENFLQVAVTYEYLYGQEERARKRYDYLKQLYKDEPHNVTKKTYDKPVTEFITATFLEDGDMQKINRGFVDGLIYQASRAWPSSVPMCLAGSSTWRRRRTSATTPCAPGRARPRTPVGSGCRWSRSGRRWCPRRSPGISWSRRSRWTCVRRPTGSRPRRCSGWCTRGSSRRCWPRSAPGWATRPRPGRPRSSSTGSSPARRAWRPRPRPPRMAASRPAPTRSSGSNRPPG